MIMLSAVRHCRSMQGFCSLLNRPEMATNLDGRHFRNLTGFKLLHPQVDSKCLEAIVAKFQEEGIW